MRARCWRSIAIVIGCGLLAASGGSAVAATLKPSWRFIADASDVLVSAHYVFAGYPAPEEGEVRPGGILIDEQSGKKRRIVPPAGAGYSCGGASAIGGPWLLFECVLSGPTFHAQLDLYRIRTSRWRVLPAPIGGAAQEVGADWIEYGVTVSNGAQEQLEFVFQNIHTGRTRPLPGWRPGGGVIPDLSSPSLARQLCSPIRVPSAWLPNGEDQPGSVSFVGSYAVVSGASRALQAVSYVQRCGTRTRRQIGPFDDTLGSGNASANANAVIWESADGVHGVYMPSLKKFTVDTHYLDKHVISPYGRDTYNVWLTTRTLYVLVDPYAPECDPTSPCPPPPSRLYATPAPRQPDHRN
jgi:hypothetical protein